MPKRLHPLENSEKLIAANQELMRSHIPTYQPEQKVRVQRSHKPGEFSAKVIEALITLGSGTTRQVYDYLLNNISSENHNISLELVSSTLYRLRDTDRISSFPKPTRNVKYGFVTVFQPKS